MVKRFLSAVLSIVIILTAIPTVYCANTATKSSIQIGDYLLMGKYYGEPILWRCVDLDENGPLMLSDKLLSIKVFDASLNYEDMGSSSWEYSNIRAWLNSNASSGNVVWPRNNPPKYDQTYDGEGAYEDEAGFLNNFNSDELNLVKSVSQKSIVSPYDYKAGNYDSGSEVFSLQGLKTIDSDIVCNYDIAYSKYITDKFFLLDVKQLKNLYNNGNILGYDYYLAKPTARVANEIAQMIDPEGESMRYYLEMLDNKWDYALRTPDYPFYDGSNYFDENILHVIPGSEYIYWDGSVDESVIGGDFPCDSSGIRPAFYLSDQAKLSGGDGSENNPYCVGHETTSYELLITKEMNLSIGEEGVINASITLNDEKVYDGSGIKWNSSDDSVVKITHINDKGEILAYVEGISSGYAVITAEYEDITAECEVAVINIRERGFDITKDGWPVSNSYNGLGHTKPYRISESTWISVYGDCGEVIQKLQNEGDWEGSCFGMCASAYVNYAHGIYGPNELNETGFDDIVSDEWAGDFFIAPFVPNVKRHPGIYEDSVLGRSIEEYQVAYGSEEFHNLRKGDCFYSYENYNELFKDVIDYLKKTNHPLNLNVFWQDGYDENGNPRYSGHSLLTDGSRSIEDIGDEWYRIYLYDPNYPHYENNKKLDLPDEYHDWDKRYIDVNVRTGEWKFDVSVNSNSNAKTLYQNNNIIKFDEIYPYLFFSDLEGIPTDFDKKLHITSDSETESKYILRASDIEIKDDDNETLLKILNGEVKYVSPFIDFLPATFNNDDNITGIVYLPKATHDIFISGEGSVSNLSDKKISSVSIPYGSVQLSISDNNNEMEIMSMDSLDIEVISANIYAPDEYDAIIIEGEMDNRDNITISNFDNNHYDISSDSDNSFDITNYHDDDKDVLKNTLINKYNDSSNFTTSDWAIEEVEKAAEYGLIPDRLLNADLTERITREEFAATAVKLYEKMSGKSANETSNPFTDIGSSPYKNEILKAYNLDITNGTSSTAFSPYDEISREQMATMLCRALKAAKIEDWSLDRDCFYLLDTDGVKKFADDDNISDFAFNAVYYMAKNGIINGIDSSNFAPKNITAEQTRRGYASATREQAVAIAVRCYEKLLKSDLDRLSIENIEFYDDGTAIVYKTYCYESKAYDKYGAPLTYRDMSDYGYNDDDLWIEADYLNKTGFFHRNGLPYFTQSDMWENELECNYLVLPDGKAFYVEEDYEEIYIFGGSIYVSNLHLYDSNGRTITYNENRGFVYSDGTVYISHKQFENSELLQILEDDWFNSFFDDIYGNELYTHGDGKLYDADGNELLWSDEKGFYCRNGRVYISNDEVQKYFDDLSNYREAIIYFENDDLEELW